MNRSEISQHDVINPQSPRPSLAEIEKKRYFRNLRIFRNRQRQRIFPPFLPRHSQMKIFSGDPFSVGTVVFESGNSGRSAGRRVSPEISAPGIELKEIVFPRNDGNAEPFQRVSFRIAAFHFQAVAPVAPETPDRITLRQFHLLLGGSFKSGGKHNSAALNIIPVFRRSGRSQTAAGKNRTAKK